MTKLTIEIPDSLHRTVKSFASAHGASIKDFFVEAATEKLKKQAKSTKKSGKISLQKPKTKSQKYITEAQADKMLKPYLIRMIKRIESGEEETLSWKEVKKQLKNS